MSTNVTTVQVVLLEEGNFYPFILFFFYTSFTILFLPLDFVSFSIAVFSVSMKILKEIPLTIHHAIKFEYRDIFADRDG